MALRRIPMDPGERSRVIRLEQLASPDEAGASGMPLETWTTLVPQMPAARLDALAREGVQGPQVAASQMTRWEINYRADMDPELIDVPARRRVVAHGRVYDITSASVIGRREGIELMTLASTRIGPT